MRSERLLNNNQLFQRYWVTGCWLLTMKVGNSTKWPPRELLSYYKTWTQDHKDRTGLMSHFFRESPHSRRGGRSEEGSPIWNQDARLGNTAVSIVAGFAYTHFRSLKFRELRLLKSILEESPWISKL